jgi:L-amino acid N-acyltransferase YncA
MAPAIRQIREADIAGFREAVDVVARERQYLYLTEAPPLEELAAMVRRNIERGSPHLVIVDGSTVVGWCNIFPLFRPVQAHVGVVAIGLVPAWRDRGWGKRLMQAALADADAFGYTRIELMVFTHNARALALYRKLGFVAEGVKRRSVRMGEVYFDEVLMARVKE